MLRCGRLVGEKRDRIWWVYLPNAKLTRRLLHEIVQRAYAKAERCPPGCKGRTMEPDCLDEDFCLLHPEC